MKEEDIKLFPHNEEAFQKLVQSLENNSFAFIEHATGTGKSLIILKYLYTKMRKKRIFFVSLHYIMFEQLFEKQLKLLNLKKEDFYKFVPIIYCNIIKYSMQKLIEDYDCFVFDEAHHCGALKWSQYIKELRDLVKITPGKKMIGLTATGTRYLDGYMDVAKEFFDGNVVSRLSIAEAILNSLLPAPLYVNASNLLLHKALHLKNSLSRYRHRKEADLLFKRIQNVEKAININSDIRSVFKKYNVHPGEKYIVFCANINDIKEKMKEAASWFPFEVKMFQAHSAQSHEKNLKESNGFSEKRDELSLIFVVNIFNEGMHIDDISGIMMFRKTTSPNVFLQQIGRVLSLSVRYKQIKIFDFEDNISENEIIRELFKELIAKAKKMSKEHPENKELYEEILSRFQIIDYTNTVLEELNTIEQDITNNFIIKDKIDNLIQTLKEFKKKYPNISILSEITEIKYKKAYFKIISLKDYLTNEDIQTLDELHIDWQEKIELSIEKRNRILGSYKNFSEFQNQEFLNFLKKYSKFYKDHGFRPQANSDGEENELYQQHRSYLGHLSINKINRMLNFFFFKSTTEELILSGNIPNPEEVELYLQKIKEKEQKGTPLDNVEKKVLKKLRKVIDRKDSHLSQYAFLDNSDTEGVDYVKRQSIIYKSIDFILKNNRRFNEENQNEKQMANEYKDTLTRINRSKAVNYLEVLQINHIPLLVWEKIFLRLPLEEKEIEDYLSYIKNEIIQNDIISRGDHRIIKILISEYRIAKKEEIRTIYETQKKAFAFYNLLIKDSLSIENFSSKNYLFLSTKMINLAKDRGVVIPEEIRSSISSLKGARSLYEEENQIYDFIMGKYYRYVIEHRRRPEKRSELGREYRHVLANIENKRLVAIVKELDILGMSKTIEEKILLEQFESLEESTIEAFVNATAKIGDLDKLDKKILHILSKYNYISTQEESFSNDSKLKSATEEELYNQVLEKILSNPDTELAEYIEYPYLAYLSKIQLKKAQEIALSYKYLPLFISELKSSKKSIENTLSARKLSIYSLISKSKVRVNKISQYLYELEKINKENQLNELGVEYEKFVDEYISFIKSHNGEHPSINEENEDETKLANIYKEYLDLLPPEELNEFSNIIKQTELAYRQEIFYNMFLDFIEANKRFPCPNADTEDEMNLANNYIEFSKELTQQQNIQINSLRKKYATNTMLASIKFNTSRN